jgi:hypothetical protein
LNTVFLEWMERLQKCVQIDGEYVGWAKRTQYIEIDLNCEIRLCYTWRGIPYSLTRHLARQLVVTKEVVKRNLQEVLGFHKFSLKWVPNVLSAEQKAARVQMLRELYKQSHFRATEKIYRNHHRGRELLLLVFCGIVDVGTTMRWCFNKATSEH